MPELDKLKEIYLDPSLDQETLVENQDKIREWEQGLILHKAIDDWRQHDITQRLLTQAKDTIKSIAVSLARNRTLTPEQRAALYAKEDAARWLVSLIEVDAKGALAQIEQDIRKALVAA